VLQFTFCSASASSVTGSLAERSTISSVIIFITVYAVVIFPVVHSWVWGDGWLQKQGFIDYSGSGIAYMTGGVCGAVGAVFIGPRHGFCSPLSATEKEIIDRNKKKDNKHKQKTNTQLRKSVEIQKIGENLDEENAAIETQSYVMPKKAVSSGNKKQLQPASVTQKQKTESEMISASTFKKTQTVKGERKNQAILSLKR